jgi:NAD(P)-dependent dehydrogenase (short-subunit alcohol dehydrogenase family)
MSCRSASPRVVHRLDDKVILVTGSTTGSGEGMVRRFALERPAVGVHRTQETVFLWHRSLIPVASRFDIEDEADAKLASGSAQAPPR